VKNPAYGRQPPPGSLVGDAVQFEVPWREGTSTRSARRDELLVLLLPSLQLPQVEILDVHVHAEREGERSDPAPYQNWDVRVDLYVVPRSEQAITIPFHASQLRLTLPGGERTVVAPELTMGRQSTPGGRPNPSLAVVSSYSEVVVSQPSTVVVNANFSTTRLYAADGGPVRVGLTCTPALAEHAISVETIVPQHGDTGANGTTEWLLRQDRPEHRRQSGAVYLAPLVD
jgi:hypothetical protein